MQARRRGPIASCWPLCLALLSGACAAHHSETVVLVPAPDGHVGAVEVQSGDESFVLDEANEGVSIGARKVDRVALTDEEVRSRFGGTLEALPLPPRSFLLYFDEGTETLVPESEGLLPEILADIRQRDAFEISVIGHTDRVADEEYNARLSMRRAEAVRHWLTDNGVPGGAIVAIGRGELDPIVPTEDGVEEPQNRRVEVSVR